MLARYLIITLSLLVAVAPATADDALTREVRHEFGDRLSPIDTLIPGYERPATPAPSLAIGDFLPADDSLWIQSFVIGEVLRWHIQFVPTVKLTMPAAFSTAIDSGVKREEYEPVLATPEHFSGLRTTFGIENGVTGTLSRVGNAFVIDAALIDTVTGSARAERSWRATLDELPAALIGISSWVYDELGVTLSAAEQGYLEEDTSISAAAIAAYIDNYEDLNFGDLAARQALIRELRAEYPAFALFSAYELYARDYPTSLREVSEHIQLSKSAREAFPDHGGVALESYRTLSAETLDEYEAEKFLNGLRELAAANPGDPMILINLAAAYGDQGDYFKAISVIVEVVERWPDNYRAWWVLGNLVNERSWQVRGQGIWRDIPRTAQERFKLLAFLSDRLTDKAISMNGRNGNLWISKLNGIGSRDGYSDRLMDAFEKAAAVAPNHEQIYANALNYSLNRWGGNAAARRHIIELAETNNPDATWPKFMRSRHEADFAGLEGLADALKDELEVWRLLENPTFWKLLFALIAGILALFGYISARRMRHATATNEHGYRDYREHGRVTRREETPEEMLERVHRQNR
jgi:tetratricopeptide (TPR) repeat protein